MTTKPSITMESILQKNKTSKFILLTNLKDLKVTALIISKMHSKAIKKTNLKKEKHLNINVVKDQLQIGNQITMSQIPKVTQLKETKDQPQIKQLSIIPSKE